jgi:hypothetical protein
MFVDGPPKHHEQLTYFSCSTSKGWPVVDSIFGGVYGIAAISAFASDSGSGSTSTGVASAAFAALFVASAFSGFSNTSECREATEELQLRLSRMRYGYPPAPPPPVSDPWLRRPDPPAGSPGSAPAAPEGYSPPPAGQR